MSQLEEIAPGVFGAQTKVSIGMGTHLPLRMTVLRTADGVALVAPIAIDDALAAAIAEVGEVRWILAPNLLHYASVAGAAKRYAQAEVLVAPGLGDKCGELAQYEVLRTGHVTPEIESVLLEGLDKLREVVFFHTPSKTLVVTDLVFNIREARGMSKFVLSLVSRALGKVEQSRLLRWLTTDRSAAAKSIEGVLDLPFERVVMAHGDVIEANAKAELTAGLWWMRGERARPTVNQPV